eukprot:scaffold117908_cov20-Tisochrysis_lutea.AAC.1
MRSWFTKLQYAQKKLVNTELEKQNKACLSTSCMGRTWSNNTHTCTCMTNTQADTDTHTPGRAVSLCCALRPCSAPAACPGAPPPAHVHAACFPAALHAAVQLPAPHRQLVCTPLPGRCASQHPPAGALQVGMSSQLEESLMQKGAYCITTMSTGLHSQQTRNHSWCFCYNLEISGQHTHFTGLGGIQGTLQFLHLPLFAPELALCLHVH